MMVVVSALEKYENANILEKIPSLELPHPTFQAIARCDSEDINAWFVVARVLAQLDGAAPKREVATLSAVTAYVLSKGGCPDHLLPVDALSPDQTDLVDAILGL